MDPLEVANREWLTHHSRLLVRPPKGCLCYQRFRLQICEHRPWDEQGDHSAISRSEADVNGVAFVDQLDARESPHGDSEWEKLDH